MFFSYLFDIEGTELGNGRIIIKEKRGRAFPIGVDEEIKDSGVDVVNESGVSSTSQRSWIWILD
jgi:hypothetical protein